MKASVSAFKDQNKKIVTLADREADIYDLFALADELETHYVIRASKNRKINKTAIHTEISGEMLLDFMRKQPTKGNILVDAPKKDRQSKRKASCNVKYSEIKVLPPRHYKGTKPAAPLNLYIIQVVEDNPPKGASKIEWVLCTNIPVLNYDDAIEKIRWYCLRWRIEVYFKVIKSGFDVERCRLETADRLIRYLAVINVVAWRVFWLTMISRTSANNSILEIMNNDEWKILFAKFNPTKKIPKHPPLMKEITIWIASPNADYPRIGIVLSSGGVRGVYAHTGFLQALEALDLPIAAMAGCSAGAIVGGIAASGTLLQDWAKALEDMQQKDFWNPDSLPRLIWQMVRYQGRGYSGLSDTKNALRFCRQNLNAETFEQCQYPFYSLAINLGTGEKAVFSEGELAPRMVASTATPVLYRPMKIEGEYYCDGAVVEFAPTDAICCRHHLDVVIVHHVSQRFDHPQDMDQVLQRRWSLLEVVDRLLYRNRPWYLSDERLTLQRCPCGCGIAIIAVEPSLQELRWPLTDGGLQSLIDAREQTETLLQPYQEALKKDPRGMLPLLAPACEKPLTSPPMGCHDA